MLSKLIVAGLGIAAAGLIAAPIASATDDMTNADVMKSGNKAAPSVRSALVLPENYGGPKPGYWLPVLDAQGHPYTDATGRAITHCVTGSCDKLGEVRVAPTACGNTYPVNEKPQPASNDSDAAAKPAETSE